MVQPVEKSILDGSIGAFQIGSEYRPAFFDYAAGASRLPRHLGFAEDMA
jgi:hypothetical protein